MAALPGGVWHSRLAGNTLGVLPPASVFGPSVLSSRPAMPSADLRPLSRASRRGLPSTVTACCQTSPGKALPPSRFCPLHLLPCAPYRDWTSGLSTPSSHAAASYAVPVRQGQRFASGFLQIPPHGGHPCLPLTVPPVGPVEDLRSSATAHLRVKAHAGRTKKPPRGEPPGGVNIVKRDELL